MEQILTAPRQEPVGKFAVFTTVLFVALAVAEVILYSPEHLPSQGDFLGLLVLVFLIILSEVYPLKLPFSNAYLGFSGTIYLTLVVLFSTFVAVIASLVAFFISDYFVRKRSLHKSLFNSIQVSLSTLSASLILSSLFGTGNLYFSIDFLLIFLLATITYWITNTGLVSIGATILYGGSPLDFWQKNFRWYLIYELTSAPISLAVAWAYLELWLPGLILLALPILMVRMAYSQYIELKKTYRETVRMLVKIIEMHDPYTAGHSDRVATYATKLCEALRLPPSKAEKIELAAYLHDLGKIHLDLTDLVRKPGKLTEEERRLVRLHSVVSADLAHQVTYFRDEIESIIRHHHENWDGTGYPHGLKGTEIPLGARIILIADAFDAMTTSRVYRGALNIEQVKQEFRKFSGIQFDPDLVAVFLRECITNEESIVKPPLEETVEGLRAIAHQMRGKVTALRTR